MTDEEVDKILCEISAEEDVDGCCRYRKVISDREALQWAAQAIVETLRQTRDQVDEVRRMLHASEERRLGL